MPLKLHPSLLTPPRQDSLNKFLSSETYQILRQVIEAKGQALLVESVNLAFESKNSDKKAVLSQNAIEDARRYNAALEVLEEIRQAEKHSTVNLNPTK